MCRLPKFEILENRIVLTGSSLLSDYMDVSSLSAEPTYTTYDSPANHIPTSASYYSGISRGYAKRIEIVAMILAA